MQERFNHKADTNPEYTQLVNRAKKELARHPGSKSIRQLRTRYK